MDPTTALLVADLVLTTVCTVLTTLKFKFRCGHTFCYLKPKDAPPSPGDTPENSPPHQPAPLSPGQSSNASSS